MSSPFRVGGAVTGAFFTDRTQEVGEILAALRQPGAVLVRGLRRQGKTSALAQAARRFRDAGGVVVWVDVSTLASLHDFRDRILADLPSRFFGAFEGLGELRPFLEVTLDPATGDQAYRFRVDRPARRATGVREQIRALVAAVDRRAGEIGTAVAFVLDEIQAVTGLGEERADWYLRSLMQETEHLAFVCAGSQPSILEAMADADDGAFYRFFTPGPRFGPIDPEHLARWIASRMDGAGVACADEVARRVVAVGTRTRDVILLAHETFLAAGSAGGAHEADRARRADAATVDRALLRIVQREGDRYVATWERLTHNQKVVVRALADGQEELFARDAAPPLAVSSVQRALEGIGAKGLLEDAPGPPRLDDPFFQAWVLRFAMGRATPLDPDGAPAGALDPPAPSPAAEAG